MTGWTVPGYEEVRDLGEGASGRVVLATHESTGTPVAIKYLSDELRADVSFLRDFRAEARLLAEVDSPNVAPLYEYVEAGAGAAIVMELVDGVSLRSMLLDSGALAPEAALCVLKGSLLGLAAAHARSVVHRDYKPENVLIDQTGQSKLADFGIATRVGRDVEVAGTPAYMAPEQWSGTPATTACDIYAVTATFFECLTGAPPYPGAAGNAALKLQHLNAPIPVEQVPASLRGLVRRGLAKQPQQRPANATDFIAELEAAARSAFGDAWETSGRQKLARGVALLSLLLPSAGGASAAAAAATALGAAAAAIPLAAPMVAAEAGAAAAGGAGGSGAAGAGGSGGAGAAEITVVRELAPYSRLATRRWPSLLSGLGLALALVVGGGASCVALQPTPVAVEVPLALTTVTPSPTATPSAAPPSITPSPSPSVTTTTTTGAPLPPPPPPPPPAFAVLNVDIVSFVKSGTNSDYFVQAKINVTTNLPNAFVLTLTYAPVETNGVPQVFNIPLSGNTSYSYTHAPFNAEIWCSNKNVKLTAKAGASSDTATVASNPVAVIC